MKTRPTGPGDERRSGHLTVDPMEGLSQPGQPQPFPVVSMSPVGEDRRAHGDSADLNLPHLIPSRCPPQMAVKSYRKRPPLPGKRFGASGAEAGAGHSARFEFLWRG